MKCSVFLKVWLDPGVIWYVRNMSVILAHGVPKSLPHCAQFFVHMWRHSPSSSVLEITLGQWAHDVVSWHFSTKDSLISGPAPPHCIQMCHQAGYAPAFTQSQALMSSIQPFTDTKKNISWGLNFPILLLRSKLASNKQFVDFRHLAIISSPCCKEATLLLLIFSMPLLVDLLQGLWGF